MGKTREINPSKYNNIYRYEFTEPVAACTGQAKDKKWREVPTSNPEAIAK